MSYNIEYDGNEVGVGQVFQAVNRQIPITVGYDARDPLNHDAFLIPRTTPMAPVRFSSTETGANTHDHGTWMPIRRVLVTLVNGATTFTVVDADPFHVGDHLISIDSLGPVTGGGLDLALITAVNYTTNVITVAATAGLAVDDWVEVYENCCCDCTGARGPINWQIPQLNGMLLEPHDGRLAYGATAGIPMPSVVVTHGRIQEEDLNFPDDATDDRILIVQVDGWNDASGGIEITPTEHGDEAVGIPDYYFPSSSSSSSCSSSFSSSSSSFSSSSSCSSSFSSSSSSFSSSSSCSSSYSSCSSSFSSSSSCSSSFSSSSSSFSSSSSSESSSSFSSSSSSFSSSSSSYSSCSSSSSSFSSSSSSYSSSSSSSSESTG